MGSIRKEKLESCTVTFFEGAVSATLQDWWSVNNGENVGTRSRHQCRKEAMYWTYGQRKLQGAPSTMNAKERVCAAATRAPYLMGQRRTGEGAKGGLLGIPDGPSSRLE